MYVDYLMSKNKKRLNLFQIEEVETFRFSIFVGHMYLQNAGCGWHGQHALSYHNYVIPVSYNLRDTVASSYSASIFVRKEPVPSEKDKNLIKIYTIQQRRIDHRMPMMKKEKVLTEKAQHLPRCPIGIYKLL